MWRITVQSQPRQTVPETPSTNKQQQKKKKFWLKTQMYSKTWGARKAF
jgi:hypothetical protein